MKGPAKKLTEDQVKIMVNEYLTTDKSAREICQQFGVTASNVVYHANKARKEKSA